jgi:outer membrane protein TolC
LAAEAATRAGDLSQIQYEDGLVTYMTYKTVLTTPTALANQQDLRGTEQGTLATKHVEVYRALGGGGEVRASGETTDLIPEDTQEEMQEHNKYRTRVLDE